MGYITTNWLKGAVLALGSVSATTASAEPNDYYPDDYQQAAPHTPRYPAANPYQQQRVRVQHANYQATPRRGAYQQPVQYAYRQDVNVPPEIQPYQNNQAHQQMQRYQNEPHWGIPNQGQQSRPVAMVPAMRYTQQVMPPRQAQPQQRARISTERMALVQAAYRALGTTYVWGGNSPREGFDCSGLTKYTHKNAHRQIPRTAREQSQASRTIRRQDLKPGDMIFFRTSGKTVNHVGIYVGDGKMIHAATGSRKVRIDDLRKSYWQDRLVKYGTFLT